MKKNIRPLMCLTGMLALLAIVSTTQAQTCNGAITQSAPDSRYLDNGDSTVSDQSTGLMWQKCSAGLTGAGCTTGTVKIYTWAQALRYVASVNAGSGFAGYSDWRLPNIKELRSLVELSCHSPAINATLFPNTDSNFYWSSSPRLTLLFDDDLAWGVAFGDGYPSYESRRWNNSNGSHVVRMVRTR